MTFVDFLLRRYGGFAPLERFSFAALAELFAAAVRADMPARAVPENNAREMSAEEIDRKLTEKFEGLRFRAADMGG